MKQKKNKLSKLWEEVPIKWRDQIISGLHTFATASLIEASYQYHLHGNALPTDKGILLAILAVVLRAGMKALFCSIIERVSNKK